MKQLFRALLICVSFMSLLHAADSSSLWFEKSKDNKTVNINVELFISSVCPYCHQADEYFKSIEAQNPWMHVTRYYINQKEADLKLFNERLQLFNEVDFSVPTIMFCKSRWVGFASAEITGKQIFEAIQYCKAQIEKDGKLSSATINALNRLGNVNVIGANMTENPSPTRYIISVALIDALNPCSLFCLISFFSLLFMRKITNHSNLLAILFILVISLTHFLQQQFVSTYFVVLPWLRIPAAAIGLVGFYYMGQYTRGRSINTIFPPLFLLIGIMVYVYQQTCLVSWTYVFNQWLNTQETTQAIRVLYNVIYQIIYVLPLLLVLLVYRFLFSMKYFAKMLNRLNLIGILVMLAVCLLLIIYPYSLANNALSMFVWVFLIVAGWVLSYFYTPNSESE